MINYDNIIPSKHTAETYTYILGYLVSSDFEHIYLSKESGTWNGLGKTLPKDHSPELGLTCLYESRFNLTLNPRLWKNTSGFGGGRHTVAVYLYLYDEEKNKINGLTKFTARSLPPNSMEMIPLFLQIGLNQKIDKPVIFYPTE